MFRSGLLACALLHAASGVYADTPDTTVPTDELDFQTAQEQRAPFDGADFTLPLSGPPGDGNIAAFFGTVDAVPALATNPDQISQARFELDACALVAPHVHPRGTELLFVYEGEVTLGWSEENGGRVIENNITAGSSGFVPQGLINWVQNNNCEPAKYVSSFGNNDFGVVSLVPQLVTVPDTVLRGTFASVDSDLIDEVLDAIANGDAPSADPECLARCGMMGGGNGGGSGGSDSGDDNESPPPSGGNGSGAAKRWAQCGGRGYSGPTSCEDGSSCVKDSEYYSQCRPGNT